MLLLLTIVLVLASAVLLIVGFVQNHLGYIFVSMGCAALALVALVLFGRLSRRRAVRLAEVGPAGATGLARTQMDQPVARRSGHVAPDEVEAAGQPDDRAGSPSAGAMAEAAGDEGDDTRWDDWGDEVVFPIEDYDDLRVAEILPLLSQLEPGELEEVRDRELAGRGRTTILQRVDDLLGGASAAKPATKPARRPAAAKSPPAKAKAAPAKASRTRKTAAKATPASSPAGDEADPAPARRSGRSRSAKPAATEGPAEDAPAEPPE